MAELLGVVPPDISELLNEAISSIDTVNPPTEPKTDQNNVHQTEECDQEPEAKKSRFSSVSSHDLEQLFAERQGPSTKKNTAWGVKIFQEWNKETTGAHLDMGIVPVHQLAESLGKFYCEARLLPKNENDVENLYHRNSLISIRTAINRHLSDIHRNVDIVRDTEFKTPNGILDGLLKLSLFNQFDKSAVMKPIESAIWYTNKSLSKRTFAKFMSNICVAAKIDKKYTPHCLRAKAIQLLNDQGYEARHIMYMSDHRCEYNRNVANHQKKALSSSLSAIVQPKAKHGVLEVQSYATSPPSDLTVSLPNLQVSSGLIPNTSSLSQVSVRSTHNFTPGFFSNSTFSG
ncbi:uncharacterized protein LOC110447090 isoform X2 [Mizuhopecten yessoensis]|uniref:uncharacterized protein LOC110447090 isoform X2 n=1 Tax=Mizuhopecten yessoensis TaxID=6573 RepID=UPI000B45B620|nr:uncharacterized protein LOC110447090 isoform X2 [Mizuhopecten yessoensis]